MAAGDNRKLEELCRVALAAVQARGHELDAWTASPGEEDIERKAVCPQCGRAVVIRAESRLGGLAGRALVESCGGQRTPPQGV